MGYLGGVVLNNKNTNSNLLAGIIGGLTAAWANFLLQNNKQEEDFHFQDIFESFHSAYDKKIDGYRLKYDIDESKVKPKYVNITKTNNWLYTISIDDKRTNTVSFDSSELIPENIERWISYTFSEYIYEGMIVVDTPLVWVYSVRIDDYMSIIISDKKIEKYDMMKRGHISETVIDSFICSNGNEAQSLANEMKRYYHTYYDRVLIKNSILDNTTPAYHPNISKFIENINSIIDPPFKEVVAILNDTRFQYTNQLIYTLFSITNLFDDKHLINAEKHLEFMLEFYHETLEKSGILNQINERLIDVYIGLKRDRKIRRIIHNYNSKDKYRLENLGRKLKEAGLNNIAIYVYEKLVYLEDSFSNNINLFEAYKTINDTISIMELKIKLETQADFPTLGLMKRIDEFLRDMNQKWREANGYTKSSKILKGKS